MHVVVKLNCACVHLVFITTYSQINFFRERKGKISNRGLPFFIEGQ
jgi:hypothetical protein